MEEGAERSVVEGKQVFFFGWADNPLVVPTVFNESVVFCTLLVEDYGEGRVFMLLTVIICLWAET